MVNQLSVLFLCTGNTSRSQMAEALLRCYTGGHFEVYSAGIEPGQFNPFTKQVLEEIDIDVFGQYAKSVEVFLGKKRFDYLITVCAQAEEKCPTVFPGVSQRLHWTFDDPAAFVGSDSEKLAFFRKIRDQIDDQIRQWLKELNVEPILSR